MLTMKIMPVDLELQLAKKNLPLTIITTLGSKTRSVGYFSMLPIDPEQYFTTSEMVPSLSPSQVRWFMFVINMLGGQECSCIYLPLPSLHF